MQTFSRQLTVLHRKAIYEHFFFQNRNKSYQVLYSRKITEKYSRKGLAGGGGKLEEKTVGNYIR